MLFIKWISNEKSASYITGISSEECDSPVRDPLDVSHISIDTACPGMVASTL